MAKRTAQTNKKLFGLNLESLLLSDCSQEDRIDVQISSNESCNNAKKLKSRDNKTDSNNKSKDTSNTFKDDDNRRRNSEEVEDLNDVTKFFENVGSDFSKSMQVKKARLGQFTESVIAVYQTKITEMIKKQEAEVEDFKKQTVLSIEEELNKNEEEFKKLKQQENKLMKILEQQLKMLQKTSTVQAHWIESFSVMHKNFIQSYEEMKNKHKDEALNLKKSIIADVSALQNKFLMEAKKEEMQTMKKYLSSVYF